MLDMLIRKSPPAASDPGGQRMPSWGEAYVRYRPLLFGALSRLAARGYTTAPDDGMDLVHDFFLEAWHGIAANYDPGKASLETYLYGSFVQFARPRIVRQHRWRDALVSPILLADMNAPDLQFTALQAPAGDVVAVRGAFQRLAPREREILAAYVSDAKVSERHLADRFSLTRYQLRLLLADALGKLAVALGEMSAMNDTERAVMAALWEKGRTVRETAQVLQVSTSEIQAMRARLFGMLSAAVKGKSRKQSADATSDEAPSVAPALDTSPRAEEMLMRAIKSGMQESTLQNIRDHKELVFEFLESAEAEPFFAKHAETFAPELLAQLYAALGCQEDTDPEDAVRMASFLEACEEDEEQIGRAFSQVLIPNLPADLTRFRDQVFHVSSMVDQRRQDYLTAQTSVRCGGPSAAELALFGITPVMIVEASQGVANLARRFCDSYGIERGQHFIIDKVKKTEGYSLERVLLQDISVREVMLVCEIPEPTAERLFGWLARVAEYAPNLFDGFSVELRGDELRATRTDTNIADLFDRWWFPPPAIAA
jgi:DNA-directed RNA polymerase specialized sigma24 family protein